MVSMKAFKRMVSVGQHNTNTTKASPPTNIDKKQQQKQQEQQVSTLSSSSTLHNTPTTPQLRPQQHPSQSQHDIDPSSQHHMHLQQPQSQTQSQSSALPSTSTTPPLSSSSSSPNNNSNSSNNNGKKKFRMGGLKLKPRLLISQASQSQGSGSGTSSPTNNNKASSSSKSKQQTNSGATATAMTADNVCGDDHGDHDCDGTWGSVRGLKGDKEKRDLKWQHTDPSPRSTATGHLKTSGGENNDSDLDISFGVPPVSPHSTSSSIAVEIFKSNNNKEDHDNNNKEDDDHDEHDPVVPYQTLNDDDDDHHHDEEEDDVGALFYEPPEFLYSSPTTIPASQSLMSSPGSFYTPGTKWHSPTATPAPSAPCLIPCSFDRGGTTADESWDTCFEGELQSEHQQQQQPQNTMIKTPLKKSLWKTFEKLQSPPATPPRVAPFKKSGVGASVSQQLRAFVQTNFNSNNIHIHKQNNKDQERERERERERGSKPPSTEVKKTGGERDTTKSSSGNGQGGGKGISGEPDNSDHDDDTYLLKGLAHLQLQEGESTVTTAAEGGTHAAPDAEQRNNNLKLRRNTEVHPGQIVFEPCNSGTSDLLLLPEFTTQGYTDMDRTLPNVKQTVRHGSEGIHRDIKGSKPPLPVPVMASCRSEPITATATSTVTGTQKHHLQQQFQPQDGGAGGIFRTTSYLSIEDMAAAAGIELSRTEYSSSSEDHSSSSCSSSSSSYMDRLEAKPYPAYSPYDHGPARRCLEAKPAPHYPGYSQYGPRPTTQTGQEAKPASTPGFSPYGPRPTTGQSLHLSKSDGYYVRQQQQMQGRRQRHCCSHNSGSGSSSNSGMYYIADGGPTAADMFAYDQQLLRNVGCNDGNGSNNNSSSGNNNMDHNHPEADSMSESALDDLQKIRSNLLQEPKIRSPMMASPPKTNVKGRSDRHGKDGGGRGGGRGGTTGMYSNLGTKHHTFEGEGKDKDLEEVMRMEFAYQGGGLVKPDSFIPYSRSQSATAAIFRDSMELEPELQATAIKQTSMAQHLFVRDVQDSFASEDDAGFFVPDEEHSHSNSHLSVHRAVPDEDDHLKNDEPEALLHEQAQEGMEGVAIPAGHVGYNDGLWHASPATAFSASQTSATTTTTTEDGAKATKAGGGGGGGVFRHQREASSTKLLGEDMLLLLPTFSEEAPSLEYSSQDNGVGLGLGLESIARGGASGEFLLTRQNSLQYDAPQKGIMPILTAPTTDTWETSSDNRSPSKGFGFSPEPAISHMLDFSPHDVLVPDEKERDRTTGTRLVTKDQAVHLNPFQVMDMGGNNEDDERSKEVEWKQESVNTSQSSFSWASSFDAEHVAVPAYNNHLAPLTPTSSGITDVHSKSTKSPLAAAATLLDPASSTNRNKPMQLTKSLSPEKGVVRDSRHQQQHRRSQDHLGLSFSLDEDEDDEDEDDEDEDDDTPTNMKSKLTQPGDGTSTLGAGVLIPSSPNYFNNARARAPSPLEPSKHARRNTAFSFTTEFLRSADVPLFIYVPVELQQAQQTQIQQMQSRKYQGTNPTHKVKRISSVTVQGPAQDALRLGDRESSHSPRRRSSGVAVVAAAAGKVTMNAVEQQDEAPVTSSGNHEQDRANGFADENKDETKRAKRFVDPFAQYQGRRRSVSSFRTDNNDNDNRDEEGVAEDTYDGNEDEHDHHHDHVHDDDTMDDDDDHFLEEEGPHMLYRTSFSYGDDDTNDDDDVDGLGGMPPPQSRSPNFYQNPANKKPLYLQSIDRKTTY
jgi:hypothetical protein